MTPNTRRVKGEKLFSAPISPSGPRPRKGGISIQANKQSSVNSSSEDSVVLWYGNDLYKQKMGFERINGLNLQGEMLNGIDHLPSASQGKDLLVLAEHRVMVLTTASSNNFSMRPQQSISEEAPQDLQRLLNRGELDLGGVEQVMESMGRRVGFAA